MREGWLTRSECTAMKGIAILGIMLHNYCHWLQGIVKENEYTWGEWKNGRLLMALDNPDSLLPLHLLSYFGHYGVPVFLFLSGFGLVMKYENGQEASLWRFFRYNYLKLFRIFIVGFVAFTMLDAFTPGTHRYQWDEVLAMLGMYANVFEHPSKVVWPGPYWYFGLTLQLYLLYRLLLYRRHWGFTVAAMLLCWLWQEMYISDAETLERLRYNFIGGMLPFGMGVLFGRLSRHLTTIKWHLISISSPLVAWAITWVLSLALVYVLCFNIHSWLWVPAFVVVGAVAFVKLLPRQVLPYIVWVGEISAAIFVSHPIVRKIFVRPYLRDDVYAGLLLYIVVAIAVAWLFQQIIHRIPKPRL